MAKRLSGRYGYPPAPHEFDVTLHEKRLDEPRHWRKAQRIFVVSMGDLFHDDVPDAWIEEIFRVMADCGHHTFQVLTKRPARMKSYLGRYKPVDVLGDGSWMGYGLDGNRMRTIPEARWPLPNVWLGVTAEDQARADERIPTLLETPAVVRFVSVEPMLGPVDLRDLPLRDLPLDSITHVNGLTGRQRFSGAITGFSSSTGIHLDWVIAGGETGPGARPLHPDWVRAIRNQCVYSGVPFFFKGWGDWAPDCFCETPRPHRRQPRPEPGKMGVMFHCGKTRAGRQIDGEVWSQFPICRELRLWGEDHGNSSSAKKGLSDGGER
jgi:protein gp37